MVPNPERRTQVCDAALELLGRDGPRGLTHRAVDAAAGLPVGTTSNYYPSRAALFRGMTERLFVLLAPDPDRLHDLAGLPADDAAPAYAGYVVERLMARPDIARAWIELRLEAARNPPVADLVEPVLRDGLAADIAFHQDRGLPGGAGMVRLLHHLVNGIVLDALTLPMTPDTDPVATAIDATRALTQTTTT